MFGQMLHLFSSLHEKDNKQGLNNWRGIFVSNVLRTIMMKLLHERAYDYTFVINSIISDVLSTVRKTPEDLLVMDFKQMFDSEEASIALNALYEAGIQDDIFALLYEGNHENNIDVPVKY